MPRGDRTGPNGMGAMTGRMGGYCSGFEMPGYANVFYRRGFGTGFGRGRSAPGRGFGVGGRGRRNMYYATGLPGFMRFGGDVAPGYPAPYQKADPAVEKQALKQQADALQSELDFINRRLAEVETENASDG